MTKIVLNRWATLLLFKKIYKLNNDLYPQTVGFATNGGFTTNSIIDYFKDLFGIIPPLGLALSLFQPYQFCCFYFQIIKIDSDTFKIEHLK